MAESGVREFRKTIRRLERLLTFDLKDTCCCSGVTMAQCHTLLELEALDQVTLGELSGRMELDKSTLSRNVWGLVQAGHIRVAPHPGDRRAVVLTLTAKGRRTCAQINTVNDALFLRVIDALPAGAVDGIMAALESFARALAAATNRTEPAGVPPSGSRTSARRSNSARGSRGTHSRRNDR